MLLVMKCGFSAYLSGVGVNIFLGSLLPGIIYLIANEVCRSRRIALASALLIALNPPMIELAVEPLRDTVYLFFAGLVICFLIFCIRRQKWYLWGITGVFLGMAFLTRYETLEFFPLAGICWGIAICRKTMDWKKLLICCFSLSAAFVVTVCLLISGLVLSFPDSVHISPGGRAAVLCLFAAAILATALFSDKLLSGK